MQAALFNDICRQLSPSEPIHVWLLGGKHWQGFPLRHQPAGVREGVLELETKQGIKLFLSSQIETIETTMDLQI